MGGDRGEAGGGADAKAGARAQVAGRAVAGAAEDGAGASC